MTRDSIETAYSFLHQKRNVYIHSSLEWQKDDIEYAIGSYVDDMNSELLDELSDGRGDFLRDHKRFQEDITIAVQRLEKMLYSHQCHSYSYIQSGFLSSTTKKHSKN